MEPDDLEKKEFLVSLRGYDRDEVDQYLREVAEQVRALKAQVDGAAKVAPAGPVPAGREDALKKVGEETSKILLAAEQVAEEIKQSARKGSEETLESARKTSEEMLADARKGSAEMLADARHQAESTHRQIQQDRKTAEDDLRRLKDARAILATQLEDVRRRLDETIARLAAPMDLPTPGAGTEQMTKEAATKASPKAEQAPAPPEVAPVVEETQEIQAEPEPEVVLEAEVVPEPEPEVVLEAEPEPEVVLEAEVVPEPEPEVVLEPEPEPEVVAEQESVSQPEVAEEGAAALSSLLEQIREERERGRTEVQEALALADSSPPAEQKLPDDPIAAREALLGELPQGTARRMKRLLQEDQNVLLDKIRTARGKGSVDDNLPTEQDQVERFTEGLIDLLGEAFSSGRKLAGGDAGDPTTVVSQLVTKQLVAPLRSEISRVVEAGLGSQDTATAIAERASDIFRVWKGVRTELLGEGMAYSAFHQGLLDAWASQGAATKHWVFSEAERECPKDVCKANAAAGPLAVGAAFPSGHIAPPAHGGCECTLTGPGA